MSSSTTPAQAAAAFTRSVSACLALPFDALRLANANAVQLGLAPRSMLWSREVEHVLVAMERMALGPMARRN